MLKYLWNIKQKYSVILKKTTYEKYTVLKKIDINETQIH